jgi:polar amino acid transport system permease protein
VTTHLTSTNELRRRRPQRSAAQGAAIAVVSTLVVLVLGYVLITRSSGWPKVHQSFFNGRRFADSLPEIWSKFGKNVRIFLVCELAILVFGLLLAVLRTSKSPALFPFRAFSVLFTDVMRGIPLTLLIFLFGFGIPGLGLNRPWNDATIWGAFAMVLVYSAYVSEVFRAGIESIHPSQMAAARGLGLSRPQGLRYIVIPQAVRRVIPPLLYKRTPHSCKHSAWLKPSVLRKTSPAEDSTSRRISRWPCCFSSLPFPKPVLLIG